MIGAMAVTDIEEMKDLEMTEEDTIGETEAVMTETIDVTIEAEDHQIRLKKGPGYN